MPMISTMFSGPCAAARTRRCDGNHPPVLERLTDPIIPKDRKGVSSRMIIDACRPFEWLQTSRPRGRDRRGVSEEFNGEVEEGTI
jgi:hypothetical protein